MAEFLLGAGIGWAAGLTPGPLHTLILAASLKRGFRAGAMVAFAPPVADIPVVPIALLLVGSLSSGWVRALALVGGLFILWLGVDTIRAADDESTDAVDAGSDLLKGVITNLLNPHPWLFWLTVGAPILVTAWSDTPARAVAFLAGFYGLMVLTKIGVAWVSSQGRRLEGTAWYRRLLVLSGGLLLVMGVIVLAGAITGDIVG